MAPKASPLSICILISLLWAMAKAVDFSYPAVFNFGDSNSDTGELVAGLGIHLESPNGQTYFQNPSGRFCDGRLIVDFLMDAMNLPFLNAYLDSIDAPSLRTGCNFAAAGSTVLPATASSISPFSFGTQVAQFLRFKARVLELLAKGVVHLPKNIATFGKDSSKLDELGCVSSHNRVAKLFNLQLHALCKKIQSQFSDANVTYVDIFSIKLSLISNYSLYGFKQPLMACCGYGGPPLNYDSRISCGQTKNLNGSTVTAKGCDDSTKYLSWDGIHYTDAANQYVSSQVLTGNYSDPPLSEKMPLLSKLKFKGSHLFDS